MLPFRPDNDQFTHCGACERLLPPGFADRLGPDDYSICERCYIDLTDPALLAGPRWWPRDVRAAQREIRYFSVMMRIAPYPQGPTYGWEDCAHTLINWDMASVPDKIRWLLPSWLASWRARKEAVNVIPF